MELMLSFFKIGAFSFGGGYAMVPFIEEEVIVRHGWLSLERFLDLMAISAMTPGPVAINAATFIGYQVEGVLGSVSATTAVVLPSFVIMLIAGLLLGRYKNVVLVKRMFSGVRPAAFALIAVAAISTGTSLKYDATTVIVGLASFAVITFTKIHPILVLVAAGASGVILYLI
ncbi:MAG TPA: chromate transporter [Clostridia bacterium]|nr:chromate transporter [Clostridia bacterium]